MAHAPYFSDVPGKPSARVNHQKGNNVRPRHLLWRLITLSLLWVRVAAPARNIAKSAPEQALEELAKGLQAESKGTLSYYAAYDRALQSSEGRELYRAYRQAARG